MPLMYHLLRHVEKCIHKALHRWLDLYLVRPLYLHHEASLVGSTDLTLGGGMHLMVVGVHHFLLIIVLINTIITHMK